MLPVTRLRNGGFNSLAVATDFAHFPASEAEIYIHKSLTQRVNAIVGMIGMLPTHISGGGPIRFLLSVRK
jgi:hypothetical protein